MIELTIFYLLTWLSGYFVLGRVIQRPRGQRLTSSGRTPTISVIIPARNEAHNLPKLLKSLNEATTMPLEILVVDDASSDQTASIAHHWGANVISAQPLPAGWTGKNWACFQGAQRAQGEALFFLDADTYFEPGGYVSCVSKFTAQNAQGPAALSWLPFHDIKRPYETLSIFFNAVMAAGAGRFGFLGEPGLFGQSLLINKKNYMSMGGHAVVKSQVLENVYLAKQLRDHGIKLVSSAGTGLLAFRMFPQGPRELCEGWIKAFASGASATPPTRLIATILWLFGFPTVVLVALLPNTPLPIELSALWYLAFAVQLGVFAKALGNFPWWSALVYPLYWLFYQIIFFRSLWAPSQRKTWKGRTLS